MCTALVVREEYWDRQIEICAKLQGIKLNYQQIERIKVCIIDFAECVGKCFRMMFDVCVEVFTNMAIIIKDSISDILETLTKLFEKCEITSEDSFDMVCDKLENRMIYLNRQNCIKQEQYYKAQFKLAKVNYNIMNHDRRC